MIPAKAVFVAKVASYMKILQNYHSMLLCSVEALAEVVAMARKRSWVKIESTTYAVFP